MATLKQMQKAAKDYKVAQTRHKKETKKHLLTRDAEDVAWEKMEDVLIELVRHEILETGVWLPCDGDGNVPSRSSEQLKPGDYAHYRRTVGKLTDFIQVFDDTSFHKNNISLHIKLPELECGGVGIHFRVDYDKVTKTYEYKVNLNVWGGAKIAPILKQLGMSIGDSAKIERRLVRLRQLRSSVNKAIRATVKRLKTAEAIAPTASSSKKRPKKK